MSQIKLKHSGGNGVIIAAPDSNPASDRTLKLPSDVNSTIDTVNRAGNILQVVPKKLTGTTYFSTTSTSFVEVTALAQTLTLSNASNKVLILVNLHTSTFGDNYIRARSQIRFGDFSNADGLSTNLLGVYNINGGAGTEYMYFPHTHQVLHTPNTTTPTYRIGVRLIESATLYVYGEDNVDGLESSIVFMEIAA